MTKAKKERLLDQTFSQNESQVQDLSTAAAWFSSVLMNSFGVAADKLELGKFGITAIANFAQGARPDLLPVNG